MPRENKHFSPKTIVSSGRIKNSCSNPALEPQIQPRNLKSCSGSTDPALELEILFWSPGVSDPALDPQIQPWSLRSSPGASDSALEPQIQPWSLRSNIGTPTCNVSQIPISSPGCSQTATCPHQPHNHHRQPPKNANISLDV